ncbi:hypothetical protein SUGI_0479680 [Cryptomeria japonica]|nr:hypothetical protein SUGI_0479680 [Cryptomeria japonica]
MFNFRLNVVACAKHLVGDGGTEGGFNEHNTLATYYDLFQIHMHPYLYSLAKGVSTIRASYSSWNGEKLHANQHLLTRILKMNSDSNNLKELVNSGKISISRIDDAVRRILTVKFIVGLFEHPKTDRSLLGMVGNLAHREIASRNSQRGSLQVTGSLEEWKQG